MAEVIAATASVIAIVQIAEHIIGTCKKYIRNVKDVPHDIHVIVVELTSLKTIFETLNSLARWNSQVSNIVRGLLDQNGPIDGCLRSIKALEQLIPSELVQTEDIASSSSKKRKVKATLASLAWPLKEGKARKLLDEISRYKETINLALTKKSMQDIEEIKTSTREILDQLTDSHRQNVYKWLHHTDPSPIHYRSQENYEPGTCDWMVRFPCWIEWLQTKKRCLWIHGIPGAGKTVLISHLIQNIAKFCDQSPKKVTYVYYYCYYGNNQDEAEPFLRWLLCQLCREAELVPSTVHKMYKYGGQPSLPNLLQSLEDILHEFDFVYVILDAIDESNTTKNLLEVLRELALADRFEKVQLLTSSRSYADIINVMSVVSSPIPMANEHVKEDIRILVQSLLKSNPKFKHWPQELLDQVEEVLPERAQGMFRWIVCQVDAIQRIKPERSIVERVLANLPKTLFETYDRIFARIPEEDGLVVHYALQWISFHGKLHQGDGVPLEILLQALGKSLSDIDSQEERYLDKDTLLELCGCLITISSKIMKHKDEEVTESVVSFAHYTVLEYLESSSDSNRHTLVGIRHAGTEILQSKLLEIVLLNSQSVNQEIFIDNTSRFLDIIAAVNGNFNNYCVMMAPLLLSGFSRSIIDSEVLYNLALRAIDPTKPHYTILVRALSLIAKYTPAYNSYRQGFRGVHFWEVKWRRFFEDTHAPQLFNFLCMPMSAKLVLSEKLVRRTDMKKILQTRLNLALPVPSSLYVENREFYEFDGSIVEIFAQIADIEWHSFPMLLEQGLGSFNPSKILFLYIGSHDHVLCGFHKLGTPCYINRLLEMGAKLDSREYRITPLQMAVACWDIDGVRILLEEGAGPNKSGNANIAPWQEGSRMSRFNHLVGLSPLKIFTSLHPVLDEDCMSERGEYRPEIEEILLRYGAELFTEENSNDERPTEAIQEIGHLEE